MSANSMTLHFTQSQKLIHSALYFFAGIAMSTALFFQLDSTARGILNIHLKLILEIWPVLIPVIPVILLMFFSSGAFWFQPLRAARTGMIASVLGWLYFLMFFCFNWLLISFFMFTSLTFWLFFTPNVILLYLTTWRSRRIIALVRERGA
jgi:hypothetical protein